jgi:hypothetical protein
MKRVGAVPERAKAPMPVLDLKGGRLTLRKKFSIIKERKWF